MDHSSALFLILIFLASAIVIVSFFHTLRINPIIGYMLAGVLLGEHGFGVVVRKEEIATLAELGVIFLLFSIGLKLTLERLKHLGKDAILVGAFQIALCGAIFGACSLYLGLSMGPAIVVGVSLALSSTALALRLLMDERKMASSYGQTALAILLIQDLAVVPMMTLVPLLKNPDLSIMSALGIASLKAIFAVVAIVVLGRFGLKYVFHIVSATKNSELFTATSLFVLLACAFATQQAGISLALGAFLAGLLLAETAYYHQVEADMHPFQGILLGLFFATVGMNINIAFLIDNALAVALALLFLVALKTAAITLLCRWLGSPKGDALRIGILLSQGGEFAFILLGLALNEQLLPFETVQVLFGAIALSMITTPFLSKLTRLVSDGDDVYLSKSIEDEAKTLRNHAIIVGFGRMGQSIAQIFSSQSVPFVGLDLDQRAVNKSRLRGQPVYFGDATNLGIYRSLKAQDASIVVLTIDEPRLILTIAEALKKTWPHLQIIARAHDEVLLHQLSRLGVESSVLETMETSLQMAGLSLSKMGLSELEISDILDNCRTNHYALLQTKKKTQ